MPSAVRSRRAESLSSRRSTTRSPGPVGSVDTRTSTCLSPSLSAMRPSCGSRFSAMSRLAMILSRDTSAACSARGGSITSRSTAVDAEAHDRARLVRLEVQVRRALAQRLQQQRVDHADHRRLRRAVEQVLARRHVLHQPREIGLASPGRRPTSPPRSARPGCRRARVRRRTPSALDRARDQRPLQHALDLDDAVGRGVRAGQHDDRVAFDAGGEHAVRLRERVGNLRREGRGIGRQVSGGRSWRRADGWHWARASRPREWADRAAAAGASRNGSRGVPGHHALRAAAPRQSHGSFQNHSGLPRLFCCWSMM